MNGIADVHPSATLTPDKITLLKGWLPDQKWFEGDAADLAKVASYRFVDPAGDVGIESMLVSSGGVTYQVPMTYRDAELPDAEDGLIGTMEHSVLGTRYVYDATLDPVFVVELMRVIREADNEADIEAEGQPVEKTMSVLGSGVVSIANAAGATLRVARQLDGDHKLDTARALGILEGTWQQDDAERNEVLAVLK